MTRAEQLDSLVAMDRNLLELKSRLISVGIAYSQQRVIVDQLQDTLDDREIRMRLLVEQHVISTADYKINREQISKAREALVAGRNQLTKIDQERLALGNKLEELEAARKEKRNAFNRVAQVIGLGK